MKLNIEYVEIDKIKEYENNAKLHPAEQIEQIKQSIRDYGMIDPIGVWHNEIVEGHGRFIACRQLGIKEVPVIRLDELSDEQRREYMLVHNKTTMNTDFDMEMLGEELSELLNLDIDLYGFTVSDDEMLQYEMPDEPKRLVDSFLIPPFSVFDTRQGYWQDRKKWWKEKTGNLSETRDGKFGGFGGGVVRAINGGTSNFDPVLAECCYRWFANSGDKILDPFGGEQTKGVVAGELGLKYTAVEIRKEQCAVNKEKTSMYEGVNYVCGDSNKIFDLIQENDFDMLLTSPPYYDLEVYSKEDMSSLGTYDEFMRQYRNIFEQCYRMLKSETFAVVKVGEIRNKSTGIYRSFVADNVKMLTDIGFKFYNDIVLVNPVGTAQLRASSSMRTRKVVKLHQNVLVFFKGDERKIADKFPQLDLDYIESEEE